MFLGKRRRTDSSMSRDTPTNSTNPAHDDLAMEKAEPRTSRPDRVTLDVGGRKFVTLASTLDESTFLSSIVSERWDHDRQPDGSYFVDANPNLFDHVLDYLRRGCMPLFWDVDKGHDFARYKALRQEADYYGIPRLERWLSEHSFLKAVSVSTRVTNQTLPDNEDVTFSNTPAIRRHVETEWVDELRYYCRALRRPAWHGLSDACREDCYEYCGRTCLEIPAGSCSEMCHKDRAPSYEHPAEKRRVLKVKVVEDIVEFESGVCGPR